MQSAGGVSGLKSMEITHKTIVMLRCKVLIVGDACVGKSALTQVFQSGGSTYPKNYLMTIGAEFIVKQVPIPDSNIIVELYIYDCAGQSIFNQLDMNAKYYDGASAVLLVYSVSSRESLQSTSKWLSSVKAALPSGVHPIVALVGNKVDLRDGTLDSRAEINSYEGTAFATSLGLKHFEASAASNTGVEDPFNYIAEEYAKRYNSEVNFG